MKFVHSPHPTHIDRHTQTLFEITSQKGLRIYVGLNFLTDFVL